LWGHTGTQAATALMLGLGPDETRALCLFLDEGATLALASTCR
jgi:hypothetical protein